MNIIKTLVASVVTVSFCSAADIKISGKVTDTGTTPLSDAVVKLEKFGLTVTTVADGNFTLTGTGVNSDHVQLHRHTLSAIIGNGVIYLHLEEKGVAEIITYTLQGKAVSRVQKLMDIGTHSIAQPYMGTGVYLYKIKSGNSELEIRRPWIGRVSKGATSSTQDLISAAPASASRANSYVPIDDIITVTKDGYLNYRVIVTNSDTSGIEIKMIACADTVRDADGNLYQALRIGNQVWTMENLRVTKYNDNTVIPHITNNTTWDSCRITETGAYCYYKNTTNSDTIKKFGTLYNWYVVSPINLKKIAPAGWHVPSDAEWDTLQNYLIANGYNWDGTTDSNKIAKSMAAKTDWTVNNLTPGTVGYNLAKNNRSGFSGLPGGSRLTGGSFYGQRLYGYWWTTTDGLTLKTAYLRYLSIGYEGFSKLSNQENCGYSVRLLRDN